MVSHESWSLTLLHTKNKLTTRLECELFFLLLFFFSTNFIHYGFLNHVFKLNVHFALNASFPLLISFERSFIVPLSFSRFALLRWFLNVWKSKAPNMKTEVLRDQESSFFLAMVKEVWVGSVQITSIFLVYGHLILKFCLH